VESDNARERYAQYMRQIPCPACNGQRLNPAVLAVLVNGHSIADVARLSLQDCAAFFAGLQLSDRDAKIADQVLKEIDARLQFLLDVGLTYLTLERAPARSPAERRSASGWPPRSAPDWWGCSTCSTSLPSGCTSETTLDSSRP